MLYVLEVLDGVRCVPLCMLEAVEGALCLLEVPEVMRCMPLYILEAVPTFSMPSSAATKLIFAPL